MREQSKVKTNIFQNPFLRTKIHSEDVGWAETLLGFFLGPFGVLLLNSALISYINVYFTDVLGISGSFLVIFPIISALVAAVANVAMGILIDRTKTMAGKARPYILLAAPVLLASGILLFVLPGSVTGVAQMFWIVISYNLYYAVANTIYSMGHSLMVPLSTRKGEQRSKLSVFSNLANSAAVGLISVVFPIVLSVIGTSKPKWAGVMSLFSGIACCGALLEFYFTRERITEETMAAGLADLEKCEERTEDSDKVSAKENIPLKKQVKAMLTEKYWWMIILFYVLWQFSGTMKNGSMTYFCNYIVGTYSDGFTQTLLAVIGGIPMALGVLLAWPLANKFGKKNFAVAGLVIGSLGGLLMWQAADNLKVVSVGLFIKGLGMIPGMYIMTALFADILDHMEWKNGFRCDGLSTSVYSAIMVAIGGICTSVMNGLLLAYGYTAPDTTMTLMSVQKIVGGSVIYNQPPDTQFVIDMCYIFFEMVCWAIAALVLVFLDVEKSIEREQKEIQERRES